MDKKSSLFRSTYSPTYRALIVTKGPPTVFLYNFTAFTPRSVQTVRLQPPDRLLSQQRLYESPPEIPFSGTTSLSTENLKIAPNNNNHGRKNNCKITTNKTPSHNTRALIHSWRFVFFPCSGSPRFKFLQSQPIRAVVPTLSHRALNSVFLLLA